MHLTGSQLSELHAQTFEREALERQGMSRFIATLRHVAVCDDCFTRFLELHEALSPTEAMVEGALESFRMGRSFRRAGVLSIVRSLAGLAVRFAGTSTDASGLAESRLEAEHFSQRIARSVPPKVMRRLAAPPDADLVASMSFRESLSTNPMRSSDLDAELSGLVYVLKAQLELTERLKTEIANRRADPSTATRKRDFGQLVERLSDSAAQHRQSLDHVLQLAADELRRRERLKELEHEFQIREDQSVPSTFEFDDIRLEVTAHWRAGQCLLMFTARDSRTQSPIGGVRIDVVVTAPDPASISHAISDDTGRAELVVGRSSAALEIEVPSSRKPWRLQLDIDEIPPTLSDLDA